MLGRRYGITTTLPPGWHGRLGRGVLAAATVPVANGRSCWGRCRPPAADDVYVFLFENSRENRSPPTDGREFPDASRPVRLGADDFESFDGITEDSRALGHAFARRTFQLSGRLFSLFVETGSWPLSDEAVADANQLLALLKVESGDFYSGTVEPARFQPRNAGTSARAARTRRTPTGNSSPRGRRRFPTPTNGTRWTPFETLEQLPRDGIFIWVGLTHHNRLSPSSPEDSCCRLGARVELGELDRRRSWEGQADPDIPEYVLWRTRENGQRSDLRI